MELSLGIKTISPTAVNESNGDISPPIKSFEAMARSEMSKFIQTLRGTVLHCHQTCL
jgi:hypothetical protein